MRKKKIKPLACYVLTVSKYFPSDHPRAGLDTDFPNNILCTLDLNQYLAHNHFPNSKIHTIRGNYELWKSRIDKVNEGLAYISIRTWDGKPYNSKQSEIAALYRGMVGIQKLEFDKFLGPFIDDLDTDVHLDTIAHNDGLTTQDFRDWFKDIKFDTPYAIIHFTNFRYEKN